MKTIIVITAILVIGIVVSISLGLKFRRERILKEKEIEKIKEEMKNDLKAWDSLKPFLYKKTPKAIYVFSAIKYEGKTRGCFALPSWYIPIPYVLSPCWTFLSI